MRSDIIVVGAGAAGLCAAYLGAKSGRDVVVLEANNWIGGRIGLTQSQITTGAEFVHGNTGFIWDLIAELGINYEIYEGGQSKSRFVSSSNNNKNNLYRDVTEIVDLIYDSIGDSRTVQEFFEQEQFHNSEAAQFAMEKICRVEGCDPTDCSISEISISKKLKSDDGKNYRIKGGYRKLISAFTKSDFSVYFQTPVTKIEQLKDEVCVTSNTGAKFFAKAVIVTVPISSFNSQSIDFVPKLGPKRLKALKKIKQGNALKVIGQLSKPMDVEENYIYTRHAIHSIWKNQGCDAQYLVGFVGGSPYVKNVENIEGGIPKAFRALSNELFGEISFDKVFWQSWTEIPWIGFSYSYLAEGGTAAIKEIQKPLTRGIFFAGEATADQGDIGTVSGAIASARRAINQSLGCSELGL